MTRFTNLTVDSESLFKSVYRNGGNSPRINGHLEIRQNSFTLEKSYVKRPYATAQSSGVPSDYLDGYYTNWSQSGFSYNPGYIGGFTNFGDTRYIDKDAEMIKLRNKILNKEFDAGVFIAERKETLRLVAGTANRLETASRLVFQKRYAAACNVLGIPYRRPKRYKGRKISPQMAFADYWLQIQYGWLALYSDIYGSLKQLHNAYNRPNKRRVSTAMVSLEQERHFGWSMGFQSGRGVFVSASAQALMKQKEQYRLMATVQIENPVLFELSSIGLTNPLSLVWEASRLSFIVDWFIPVGDYLSQLIPPLGCTVSDCFATRALTQSITYPGLYSLDEYPVYYYTSAPGLRVFNWRGELNSTSGSSEFFALYRYSVPFEAVSLPHLDVNLSPRKAISALALLQQNLGKRLGLTK